MAPPQATQYTNAAYDEDYQNVDPRGQQPPPIGFIGADDNDDAADYVNANRDGTFDYDNQASGYDDDGSQPLYLSANRNEDNILDEPDNIDPTSRGICYGSCSF